jgi:hypothetical protein
MDYYQLPVPSGSSGQLTARVGLAAGTPLLPRLTLLGPDGRVLVQSDDGVITQYLGRANSNLNYTLAISARSGAGAYQLTSTFVPGSSALDPLPVGLLPDAAAVADLTGDGNPDLIVANGSSSTVSVFLGNGDGTFRPAATYRVGLDPDAVAVADLNGDGIPDLIVTNFGNANGLPGHQIPGSVSVLLGNGDGTFQPARTIMVGLGAIGLAPVDLIGNGNTDLIVANQINNTVSVLLGNGNGTFQNPVNYPVGAGPSSVAVADLTGDGILDLVVANQADRSVSVLLGNRDGTFQNAVSYHVGLGSTAVAVADLTGDGKPDLIVTNAGDNTVSILLGNGDGTFQPARTVSADLGPIAVAVADVNGDGKLDLVVANEYSNNVSVLLGNGDGTFQPAQNVPAGLGPRAVVMADVTGDGIPDLVVVNKFSNNVTVLPGNGDGTFQNRLILATGQTPQSVAVADVNGDGIPDLTVANFNDSTVSVFLGKGDGTFQDPVTYAIGLHPTAVVVKDINGDGRPDLIVANSADNTVTVLLGQGDGSFRPLAPIHVGTQPTSLAVADLTGNGIPDLVVTNGGNGTVSVLLGKGDGTFQAAVNYPVGADPVAVHVADLNHDGKLDLAVANFRSDKVSVLLGNGDGTFGPAVNYAAGPQPNALAVADVNGDGNLDLIVTDSLPTITGTTTYYPVSVLLGNGNGTFQPPRIVPLGSRPSAVAVADLNGDGIPDLVVTALDNNVHVLLGNGDATFRDAHYYPVGSGPVFVAVADFNGDGVPDLVVVNAFDNTLSVLLGNGDGTFTSVTPASGGGARNTPYLADLDGDGIPDSVILDRSGNILFRKGLPGIGNPFTPPVVLNPGRPARDLTLVRTGSGWSIAAADARVDPALSSAQHAFVYTVSLYTIAANGSVSRKTAFSTTALPTRVAAADLTGNGLDDLVAADSVANSVTVALQTARGQSGPTVTVPVGMAPSNIAFADVDGDGRPDIVVTDQASGDVTVLFNDANHSFTRTPRFRAGTGLYGLDTTTANPAVRSQEESVSLAGGDFTGNGRSDLVVVNRGAHSFTVLANDGSGGFANPQAALTTSTSDRPKINEQPGPVVAGDFHGDGKLDLAILMEDQAEVWIYTGDGHDHFTHTFSVPAGTSPTGLSVVRNAATGFLDLLVGDPFGDILYLQGKGDGTFQLAGSRTSLDVQDLGNGYPDVLVANQETNRVSVQAPVSGAAGFTAVQTLGTTNPAEQLAPGAVQWAKLEGASSPFFDAVVVCSGSNDVLVYRGTGFAAAGRPTFAPPQTYFVGTEPVSVTIQDINGDGVPDMLVADQGSNDVAILFGSLDAGGHWAGTPGPRLKSGGSGPVAVAVRDVIGDGIPDLVVTNGGSGNLAVLRGLGLGFFDDQNPAIFNLPGNPALAQGTAFIGVSTSGVVLTAAGRLVGFNLNNFAAAVGTVFTPEPGQEVMAVEVLADGRLVAAEQGGVVALLETTASGTYQVSQKLTPLTGIPSDPSALAVLERQTGLRVLVTSEGEDRLFEYAGAAPAPGTISHIALVETSITLPPIMAGAPIAETTTPSESPLVLVVVLNAGLLPGENPSSGEAVNATFAAAAAGASATGTGIFELVLAALNIDRGAWHDDAAGTESNFGLGIEQKLRQLDLYQKPRERQLDNSLSRATPDGSPRDGALALAVSWQQTTEGARPESRPAPNSEVSGQALAVAILELAPNVIGTEQPPTSDAELGPRDDANPACAVDGAAGIVAPTARSRMWLHALVAAFTAAGLAQWTERQWPGRERLRHPHEAPRLRPGNRG